MIVTPAIRDMIKDGERIGEHTGRFYTLRDALVEPRPIQPRLPILIGGIFRGAGRFGRGGPHGHGPGPWNEEGRRRVEERAREWHEGQHGGEPPTEAQPAG